MLDINLFRDNSSIIKENLKKRGMDDLIPEIDKVIPLDKKWRESLQKEDSLRKERNETSISISKEKDASKKKALVAKAKKLSDQITELEPKTREFQNKRDAAIYAFPNILHSSVPVGASAGENKVFKEWGKKPSFSFTPKGHEELLELHGMADFERAAKISGSRFYFLKNFGVLLDNALQQFALDFLSKEGFSLIRTPELLTKKAISTAISFNDFENVIYKIQDEDLYLIGTAEHPITAMHSDEIINSKDLPLKYAGLSSCFRKEAGAHGKDTKGLYRVHEFRKVEQYIICHPEDSWKFFEYLVSLNEKMFQALEIPYRLVNVCTGDIGVIAAKKIDLEAWLPPRNDFGEMTSCSNCTDFQARRAKLRFFDKAGKTEMLHTINSTAVATPRTIVALLENHQKKGGSISIPKALQPYLNNLKELVPK